uniref:Glycosyltransferase family 92 protein n=1 Tax=Macrostomum lignano TaxID=282301 RepID=A0A1I8GNH3_9PLAT
MAETHETIALTHPMKEFRFQSIRPGDHNLSTYSAFHDRRDSSSRPVVRVLAVALLGGGGKVLCQLWYRRAASVMAAVPAEIEVMPDGEGQSYESWLISCKNPAADGEVPYAVSFVRVCIKFKRTKMSMHPVIPLPSEPVRNGRFAVCMSPLKSKYDKVDELVQTLELNRLFGADHFFVYKHSTSRRVTELLSNKHFSSDVTVLPFHPPQKVDGKTKSSDSAEEVKYYGTIVMLQDCVLRTAAQYEFVVSTDTDEVIVPRGEGFRSWRDLTRAFMSDGSIGGLLFQNSFFRLEWASDPGVSANTTISGLKLNTLLKLNREAEVHVHGSRSKMIIKPHFVLMLGVNYVWQYLNERNTEFIKYNVAGLHHYSIGGSKEMHRDDYVRDPLMLQYREQLVAKVLRARTALGLPVS